MNGGATDETPVGSALSMGGEPTGFGTSGGGSVGMSSRSLARIAALLGILGGLTAIGGGLYAHFADPQPEFGIASFLFVYGDLLSGVHVLVGLGIAMVVGGVLSFRWPSVGGVIVCVAAMIGLIYTYDRGQYRWTPHLYYWWGPWLFAWLCGIFAGYAAFKKGPQSNERLADARPAEGVGG